VSAVAAAELEAYLAAGDVEFVVDDINVSRQTASKYLRQLEDIGILKSQTRGKNTYFINEPLVQLVSEGE